MIMLSVTVRLLVTYELKKVSLLRIYLTTCPSQYLETDNTCD